jgi:predicted RNA-binding Zn-ribbon protein involved in translation (DUF1610 family)
MTDLERFFRRLVDNLIAIDPARLHRPIRVGEIFDSIVPYRTNRRPLELETNEDYDLLLMRLCAGQGGYFEMVSEPVQQQFALELQEPNPDLALLHELADADVRLGTEPLAHALGPDPEAAFAPPEILEEELPPVPAPAPAAAAAPVPAKDRPEDALRFSLPEGDESARPGRSARCSYCGGALPANRAVNFCPHCGQNQVYTRCPECQSEIELGWKHCVSCGHFVGEA